MKIGVGDANTEGSTSRRSGRKNSYVQVDSKLCARLEWLNEDEGGTKNSKTGPVTLYIDGETIIEPIEDLTALRRGDHCLVGLNAARRIHPVLDWFVFKLGEWDVLRLYHHFGKATTAPHEVDHIVE